MVRPKLGPSHSFNTRLAYHDGEFYYNDHGDAGMRGPNMGNGIVNSTSEDQNVSGTERCTVHTSINVLGMYGKASKVGVIKN